MKLEVYVYVLVARLRDVPEPMGRPVYLRLYVVQTYDPHKRLKQHMTKCLCHSETLFY
jgi:hypothetical protein